jgi:predicted HNH restriction endonuclease
MNQHRILSDDILLTASKRETSKELNEKFINGIEKYFENKVSVEIQIPQNEKGLQVVDFCSWSVFRKYEYGDDSFYEVYKEKFL